MSISSLTAEKHTPGPWIATVVVHDKQGWSAPAQCVVIQAPGEILVATYETAFNEYPDDSVNEANARLIAAAPDLLEALADMVESFEPNAELGFEIGAIRGAKAALEKARG